MKKIIISILAVTMCSSLSFGKSKIEGKKKLINSIPKELIITKEKSTQEDFQKEILEIHNEDIKEFTLAVTIADTDSNIEGLEFVFLDDEMKFVVDRKTYNSLTELERSSLSNKIFAQKIFEENGTFEFSFQSDAKLFYIGIIYRTTDGKQTDLSKLFHVELSK
ncbi:MAG: hypothetical protein HG454_004710 [Clostridiales bacterium]|jgi:hypothetical protein|nr:hypothetical protein [Clostridiales bacterium]